MAEPLFHTRIHLTNHVTKKNGRPIFKNKRTGKFFLGKYSKLKNSEEELISMLKKDWAEDKEPITEDIQITFTFYFEYEKFFTKKGIRSKLVGDLDNLFQMPLDALQKAKIIKDDYQVMSLDGSRKLPGETTCLDITIYNFNNEGPTQEIQKKM